MLGPPIVLILVLALLLVWDFGLLARSVVSNRWARRYADRVDARWAVALFRVARAYAGLVYRVDVPTDLPQRFILVSNHQSFADIAALFGAFPAHKLRFVAKQQLAYHFPLASRMLRVQRHALIDRGASGAGSVDGLRRFVGRLPTDRGCPVIFPEGTRAKDGALGVFHSGGFRILCETAALPVVVVAVDGGYRFSQLNHLADRLRAGSYRVAVVGTFPAPSGKREALAVLDQSRLLISAQLDTWRRR